MYCTGVACLIASDAFAFSLSYRYTVSLSLFLFLSLLGFTVHIHVPFIHSIISSGEANKRGFGTRILAIWKYWWGQLKNFFLSIGWGWETGAFLIIILLSVLKVLLIKGGF